MPLGRKARDKRRKLTPINEGAAIRRLNAALGIETPANHTFGLLLMTVLGSALGLLMIAIWLGGGPPQRVYGMVIGFTLQETDHGSLPLARVRVDDREALVRLPRAILCKPGDRVELYRSKALLGYRYRLGFGGCVSVS